MAVCSKYSVTTVFTIKKLSGFHAARKILTGTFLASFEMKTPKIQTRLDSVVHISAMNVHVSTMSVRFKSFVYV